MSKIEFGEPAEERQRKVSRRQSVPPRLNFETLQDHEKRHAAGGGGGGGGGGTRVARVKQDGVSMSGDSSTQGGETSTSYNTRNRRHMLNKRAFDVTRRLSMSANMFSGLDAFLQTRDADSGPKEYENTFKMTPDEGEEFVVAEVRGVIEDVLATKLAGRRYRAEQCKNLSTEVSNTIKTKVKCLGMSRYKFIVNVILGERQGQGVSMASRSLWNEESDSYAWASYQSDTVFAVATVHGVYFE